MQLCRKLTEDQPISPESNSFPVHSPNVGKEHAIREFDLKDRVGGEADVLDGGQGGFLGGEKQHFCAAQGGVSGGVNDNGGRFDEADADGALDLYIIAERAGEMNTLEVACAGAQALEQQLES